MLSQLSALDVETEDSSETGGKLLRRSPGSMLSHLSILWTWKSKISLRQVKRHCKLFSSFKSVRPTLYQRLFHKSRSFSGQLQIKGRGPSMSSSGMLMSLSFASTIGTSVLDFVIQSTAIWATDFDYFSYYYNSF